MQIVGNDNLQEGNNSIVLTVTAANGLTKRDYKIIAYKRNINEEKIYNEEQEQIKDKLDEAYKIEKISTDTEENVSQKTEQAQKNYYFIAVGIIAGAIIIIIVSIFYRKKKRQ